MTILDAGNLQEMRVWVMKPVAAKPQIDPPSYSFPWTWNNFIEHKRLIVTRHASMPGAMGSADFKLLRNTIDDNWKLAKHPFTWDETANPLVPGMYVVVTAGTLSQVAPAGTIDYTKVVWFGFIDQVDGDQLTGTTELVGSVSALEVGHLLDRIQARGWARSGGNPSTADALVMSVPDSANIGGKVDGQVIGNAILSKDNNGAACYLFQNDPAKCSTVAASLFTRWRLFRHFIQNCLAGTKIINGVTWLSACFDGSQADDPAGNTIAGYLNKTAIPEVFKLRNQTCKGILDLLIPRPYGFGWTIGLSSGGNGIVSWRIVVYTLNESGYGLPSFTSYATPIDLGALPVLNWHRHSSSVDVPDEIIVEGNQIIFGVTGSVLDGNLDRGWTAAQETLYRAGASSAPGYAALTVAEQLQRNRSLRNSPALSDVFTRYTILGGSGQSVPMDLRRKTSEPGTGRGDDQPMCPDATWDDNAGAFVFNSSISRAPYLPTATLATTLPWIDGFLSNGTDSRPAYQIPWPAFARPKLFYYDPSKATGKQWTDLLARGGATSCPGLDISDRGAALKVTFDAPERMGYGTIVQGVDAIYDTGTAVSSLPWVEGVDGFDWRKVAVTFGIPSDQRISYRIRRPGIINDSDVRNSYKITDDKYNLWIMHRGSILGLQADGTPDRVNGFGPDYSVVVRNDFPALVAHANRLASFMFRRRRGFVYTGMRPDQAWAGVGWAISTVTDGASVVTYNTVVERVECTYGEHPRLTIEADLPSTPTLSGTNSTATGGPVGLTMNGTISQYVAQVAQDVKALQADGQRAPLIPAYNPGGGTSSAPAIYIISGNNALPGAGQIGIARRGDAVLASELPVPTITPAPAPGDTVTVPAFPAPSPLPNGVGIGVQLFTGAYVFVLLDINSTVGIELFAGNEITSGGTRTLAKVSGGITYNYVCQIPYGTR